MMARILLVVAALSVVAIVVQTSVLSAFAVDNLVPQVVLLVVVSAGLARDSHTGMVAGFVAGLLLDLTPPADHAAGRWALALLLAGYLAGKVRESAYRVRPLLALITVAVCSFVASASYVLTGVLTDETASLELSHLLLGVGLDVLCAPLVVPWVVKLLDRITAREVATA